MNAGILRYTKAYLRLLSDTDLLELQHYYGNLMDNAHPTGNSFRTWQGRYWRVMNEQDKRKATNKRAA